MARGSLAFIGTALAASAVLGACSVGNDCDFGLCAEYTVIDGGGDVVAPPIPADCDITKSPSLEPTCVVDEVGIFVSPNGNFGASGTKADPVKTINEGVEKATATKRTRVYVCEGTYAESISLTSAIGIYGGYDCTFQYTKGKPQITSASGVGVAVRSVTDAVVVEDMIIKASSRQATPGDSAIAVLVLGSASVTLRRVELTAGAGQPGQKGGSLSNYAGQAPQGGTGAATTGGSSPAYVCLDGTSSTGGHGANGDGAGFTSGTSKPVITNPNAGASLESTCMAGSVGQDGAATPATGGLAAAPGIVTMTGWDISKLGDPASNGNPAQGGGGGGARTGFSESGGGGGSGGCGGAGAKAGTNGGASIGLLSFKSKVSVESGAITTAIGGKGGQGGDGQPGQGGGDAGKASTCFGGTGGNGAGGNGGAGGAGGDSIAVASGGGEAPLTSADTTLTVTSGGAGGDGGAAGMGSGNPGNTGKTGIAGRSLKTLLQ